LILITLICSDIYFLTIFNQFVMRKLLVLAACSVLFAFSANASYKVLGAAQNLGSPGGGRISWSCPPPNVTCFTHNGPSTSPTAGDKIDLVIGTNHYDVVLMSVKVPPSQNGAGGSYTGQLVNPADWDVISAEMGN